MEILDSRVRIFIVGGQQDTWPCAALQVYEDTNHSVVPFLYVEFSCLSNSSPPPMSINIESQCGCRKHPPSTCPHTPHGGGLCHFVRALMCPPTPCSPPAPHNPGGRRDEAGCRPLRNKQNFMLTIGTWEFIIEPSPFSLGFIISTNKKSLEHPAAWTHGVHDVVIGIFWSLLDPQYLLQPLTKQLYYSLHLHGTP